MTPRNTTLPPDSDDLFLTDGGLETTLIFLEGYELPFFAAFDLLKNEKGYQAIHDYYLRYLNIAREFGTGFIFESPTWRANPDWIKKLDYPDAAIEEINQRSIQLLLDLKGEFNGGLSNMLISGCVGPRGDGYLPGNTMTVDEAQRYHSTQIEVFSRTPVDMITALTMNYETEAIGIARAANARQIPVVISFTVETNGMLPSGASLKEGIERVDEESNGPPLYYMINCAHPSHFFHALEAGQDESWTKRIKGIRANASCKSHAELDETSALDRGDPVELGYEYNKLKSRFGQLNVFGGCCGTDEGHILEIIRQIKPELSS